jgi:hypothetical protein
MDDRAKDPMETPPQPKRLVAVMGADVKAVAAICRLIEEGDFRTAACTDLNELKSVLEGPCMAAILDIDTVPMENRTIRALTLSHAATYFLSTSKKRLHPDLQDVISNHLFACLGKPVDPEELHYFLNCIRDSENESRGPPFR